MKVKLSLLTLLVLGACSEAKELPQLNLSPEFSVSGISSGAYMATQMHIAYGERINHVGLVAGGPYGCAQGDLALALAGCVDKLDVPINLEGLMARLTKFAEEKKIAPLTSIEADKVLVFHGKLDKRVHEQITQASASLYQQLKAEVRYVNDVPANHAIPTIDKGNACGAYDAPYIGACQYDFAGEVLNMAYGELHPRVATPLPVQVFHQKKYADENGNTLGDEGYIYIPESCAKGEKCRLHVAFHGCQQNADSIDQAFVNDSGFNHWAEANDIVVLYPQTKSSFMPLNPKACWDWWGYTGKDYDIRSGAQIKHVINMVNALSQKP